MNQQDKTGPYAHLSPAPPTPADEICTCENAPPIVLRYVHTPNPLNCAKCNLELPPERIGLPGRLPEWIANWRNSWAALYTLWLDSADYADWARDRLLDKNSYIHKRGIERCAHISEQRECYYAWFQDVGDSGQERLTRCPICGDAMEPLFKCRICKKCRIAALA